MPGSKKYHYAIRCKWFSVPKTTHSGSRYVRFYFNHLYKYLQNADNS